MPLDVATQRGSRRLVLVAMCTGYFLVLLDVTIVNVALPKIASGLGASVSGLQWVVDGYSIVLASLMLAGGTIGDVRGHKRILLSGMAIFAVASLGCGLAPTTGVLVACRAMQGLGAALMLPGTLAVITHAYPDAAERTRAIGIWAGIGGAALPAGPVLGGVLIQAIGWRAVFFLNLPIVAVALPLSARVVRESADPQGRRLDVPGVVLGGLTLAAVTYAFVQAGHAGVGPQVVVAVVVAAVAGAAFVVVERAGDQPMLPLALFRRPIFTTANGVAGTMNLVTLGLLFVTTLYLQDIRHHSALAAGLALFPLFLPVSFLPPAVGRAAARVGFKWPMAAGLLVAATGLALLARVSTTSGYPTLLPVLLLWGVGLGLLAPAVVAAAIGAVPAERAGLASGVNNTARQAGGAIGIAAFGALAGSPEAHTFMSGLHAGGLIGAGLFAAACVVTLAVIPGGAARHGDER